MSKNIEEEVEVVDIPLIREELSIEETVPFKKSVRKFHDSYKSKIRESKEVKEIKEEKPAE